MKPLVIFRMTVTYRPEELKGDYVDDYGDDIHHSNKQFADREIRKEKHHHRVQILTNTTLSVLRQMGKYVQMSRLLKPIAYQIISCMNQLFDYYLFSVHLFFANDLAVSSSSLYSNELNITLKKISDNLILEYNPQDGNEAAQEGKIPKAALSPMVDLTRPEKLHGLAERMQASNLKSHYHIADGFLKPSIKFYVKQISGQHILGAIGMRYPVYMAVVAQAFDLRQILITMSKINWEVKDVMSQHN
ncbi:hypothetical protein NQ317_016097 [Molorchus minor]|uniref:Uncharacterized protein n=1 Tax=Molorchus minor TaxID=1323400 RepID=A0ABQ9JJH7_9CUCU|nr:hypothetical protein NQ317_016097 [Molorchus minor]